ncbi:MAG TPA: hypothetical protein VFN61_10550 [Acidimicrobiales bacterium]|nr:hypothetical protein [Acidimicrobiales bacterium]
MPRWLQRFARFLAKGEDRPPGQGLRGIYFEKLEILVFGVAGLVGIGLPLIYAGLGSAGVLIGAGGGAAVALVLSAYGRHLNKKAGVVYSCKRRQAVVSQFLRRQGHHLPQATAEQVRLEVDAGLCDEAFKLVVHDLLETGAFLGASEIAEVRSCAAKLGLARDTEVLALLAKGG